MLYDTDKVSISTSLLIILTIIALSIPSLPAVSLAKTKFLVKPMLSLSTQFDSNFYKSEENERGVFTYLVQPGIQLGAETTKSKVLLNYTLDAHFYEDKSSVPEGEQSADEDNYFGHIAILEAMYSPVQHLTLGLNDSFIVTRRPAEADEFSNSIAREKYWVNRFTPGIFYEFKEQFSAGLRYRRSDIDYYESEVDDFTEHRWLFDLLYNPSRTTTLGLEHELWILESHLYGEEYISNQTQLVFEKRYKYFSFDGGVGYHNRDFKEIYYHGHEDLFNFKFSVTGQNPPPPNQMKLRGKRLLREKSHIYLAAERNFNNLGYYYDLYEAYRFTGSIGHVFMDKIEAIIRGYYQTNKYINYTGATPAGNTELREDDVYDISGKIGYLIKENMSISLTAGQENRESNLAGYDYKNNYIMLSFDFNYDIGSRGAYSKEASYYR